jgi:nucleoside-diphosphate-sugar epimerase
MRILVTGGSGLIGSAVVRALLQRGHEVRLLARRADEAAAEYPGGVQPVSAAIDDDDALQVATHGCDAIIHLAGILTEEPPAATYEKVNVGGTAKLLKAAAEAGAPFFVFVSSLGADRGGTDYHQSKRAAEEHVRAYAGPWLILRPGNVYGPGDETVSLLLKMLRSLPAVPVVGEADQKFQPLWCDDFGEALAQAVERRELAGRTLELSGPEVTTTADLLQRLAHLTDRPAETVSFPTTLAQAGTALLEKVGGERALRALGFSNPLSPAKLGLLLEETLVAPEANALTTVFHVAPTTLDEGLAILVDALPEQSLSSGVGALSRAVYWAEIVGGRFAAEPLIAAVAENIAELMPIEFAAEPGAATTAEPGATLTGDLPLRGHFQVRVVERTERSFTFVTVEGHPLAGVVTLAARPLADGVRFEIRVVSRSADVFDWIAMRTLGGILQSRNWRRVVRRVVELSGGTAPAGVERHAETVSESEAQALERWAEELVQARKREENAASLPQK